MSEQAAFVTSRLPATDRSTLVERAREIFDEADGRRSVRHFSDEPIPREVLEWDAKTCRK